MQKKLIAAAVASLASAGAFAQSNVEIYGLIELNAVSYTGSYSGQVGGTVDQAYSAPMGAANGGTYMLNNGFYNGVGKSGHSFNGTGPGAGGQQGMSAVGATLTEYGSRAELANTMKEESRIGFRGTEDLGGGLKAGFVIESSLANDGGTANGANATPTASILGNREATVSLTSASLGRIKAGRQSIANTDLIGFFDPFLGKGPGGIEQLIVNPVTSTTANNAIRFDTKLMDVNLTYEYAMSENSDRLPNSTGIGSVTGLAAYYSAGPLALAVGHAVVRDSMNPVATATALGYNTAAQGNTNTTGQNAGALVNAVVSTNLGAASGGAVLGYDQDYVAQVIGGQYAARSLWLNHLAASYDFGVAKLSGQYITTQSAKTASDEATVGNLKIRKQLLAMGVLNQVGGGEAMVNSSTSMLGITVPMGAHKFLGSFVSTNDKRTFNMDGRSIALGYEYALSKRTTFQMRGAKVYNTNGSEFGVVAGGGQATALNSTAGSANNRTTAYLAGVKHSF